MKDLNLEFPSKQIALNYLAPLKNCEIIHEGSIIIQPAIYEDAPPDDFVSTPHKILISEAIYSEEYYVKVRYYGDEESQEYLNLWGYLDPDSKTTIMGGDIPYNPIFKAIANA